MTKNKTHLVAGLALSGLVIAGAIGVASISAATLSQSNDSLTRLGVKAENRIAKNFKAPTLTKTTVSGVVDFAENNMYVIKTSDGYISVQTCPMWYKDIGLKAGESVSVTGGSHTGKNGEKSLIAYSITKADGSVITLQDGSSTPAWAGKSPLDTITSGTPVSTSISSILTSPTDKSYVTFSATVKYPFMMGYVVTDGSKSLVLGTGPMTESLKEGETITVKAVVNVPKAGETPRVMATSITKADGTEIKVEHGNGKGDMMGGKGMGMRGGMMGGKHGGMFQGFNEEK